MGIKASYRIFFAIPFDKATYAMYERIAEMIRAKYSITTIMGTREIGPSRDYSDIASFKDQNTEMIEQMRLAIEGSDIIVADMTHNNPNVHFELGIALYLNKNIFKVTGRSLTELGFDIRGLEIFAYRDADDLFKRICNYLDLFMKIKNLPLSPEAGSLYQRFAFEKPIDANTNHAVGIIALNGFRMRDGVVETTFAFETFMHSDDWFGIYLRFDSNPMLSSYLVYCRQNGLVEIAAYPGTKILKRELLVPGGVNCEKVFSMELEGETVEARIDGKALRYDRLEIQSQGNVWLAAHQCKVICSKAEAVCHDTIN
jgi:hypothetical protein